MPVEKSGQNEFDFQYGEDFGAHIEKFDPFASKVLVRYNPDGDAEMNQRQLGRLKQLADWLHDNGRLFLFELLVPAEDAQLEAVGGDTDRYDAELRPELMRRAIEHCQNFGIEVDIWKIEGVDARADAEMLSEQARKGEGRENVKSVLLGRGATDEKVDHWLQQAARVEGFIGFAIGRSIWWDALKGFLDGSLDAQRGGRADRRQLPALHQGLRRCGVCSEGLTRLASGSEAVLMSPSHADAAEHRRDRRGLLRGDRRGPRAARAPTAAR